MILILGEKKILGCGCLNALESPLFKDSLNEGVVGDDGFLKIGQVKNDDIFRVMQKIRIRMILSFGIDREKMI